MCYDCLIRVGHADRLLIGRKGIADEELAKKEAERDGKRKADPDEFLDRGRNRSSSASSFSSASVSTISTNLSRSSSPKSAHSKTTKRTHGFANELQNARSRHRKRSSSSISARSKTSSSSREEGRLSHRVTVSQRANLKRRRRSRSPSRSYSSSSSPGWQQRNRSRVGDRNTRRRHSSFSPDRRGRDRSIPGMKRRRSSRSRSRDRSEIARHRHSMTPISPARQGPPRGRGYDGRSRDQLSRQDPEVRYQGTNNRRSITSHGGHGGGSLSVQQNHSVRKERSLSPFSKRLALTQAMNMGAQ